MFGPIDSKDAAKFGIVTTPAMKGVGLGKRLMAEAFRASPGAIQSPGWHTSLSDSNRHLSIRNAEGEITAHLYSDGVIKGVNSRDRMQGKSGALSWLLPNLADDK